MRFRKRWETLCLMSAALVVLQVGTARAQRFFPDDPIWDDRDRIPIPRPHPVELSQIADFFVNTVSRRPAGVIPPAANVNTLGEVPNSSWFTNRIGRREMRLAELARGPNSFQSPDFSVPWEVLSIKAAGVSPGLLAEDGRGDRYLLKFDVKGYPQLASSAEVISTKFFYAFGYHVPENYLVFLTPEELVPSPEATVTRADRPIEMTREHIEYFLDRVGRFPDGSYPVLASKYVSGTPVGPFEFFGVRSDDPNDIFDHEDRRELRGLRLLSAWLNHNDSRSINTLNTYIPKGDQGYLRHYLIDFGTTLGSGGHEPEDRRAGHEYLVELGPIMKAAATAGIWDRSWRGIVYPDLASIGNFESEVFQPEKWKPEYPNPAFERMLIEDAFWAAKIIHRFTDERVRAIVEAGRLRHEAAESYLVQTLIERRDKIVLHYFARLNPLDGFRVVHDRGGESLVFDNLGIEAGLARDSEYSARWYRFDNEENSLAGLPERETVAEPRLSIPDDSARFLMVRIRTLAQGHPLWSQPVDVYLRNPDRREVVGIERDR